MLNRSYSQSILKQANKSTLDTTRYTSGSNFYNNSQTVGQQFPSQEYTHQPSLKQSHPYSWKHEKYDDAFRKARTLVDELIGLVQDNRQAARLGIKNVGDTNQFIIDLWSQTQIFDMAGKGISNVQYPSNRQPSSRVDPQKLQMLKLIQNQRTHNQNLERKCYQLQNQNKQLRSSRVQATSMPTPTLLPNRVQPTLKYPNAGLHPFAESRLFAQLQNLKQQNQLLRQKSIKLLQSHHY